MTSEERAKEIRAVCDCLRYVKSDVEKANLPIVSLHVGLAISEAETVLDELGAGQAGPPEPLTEKRAAGGSGF